MKVRILDKEILLILSSFAMLNMIAAIPDGLGVVIATTIMWMIMIFIVTFEIELEKKNESR